jgi:hypothetical protein
MSVLPVRRSCLDRRHNKRLLAVRAPACPPLRPVRGACARASCGGRCRKLVEDSGSRPGYEGSAKNICRSSNVNSQKKVGIKRDLSESSLCDALVATRRKMSHEEKDGMDRRGALECMIWAGTGVLWTMVAGVPRSSSPPP